MRGLDLQFGRLVAACTLAALFAAVPASAALLSYILGAPAEGDAVVFTSHAPLEDFKGRTDAVSGELRFDPDDLSAGIELRVEVELAEFDTGIGLRNRHMRENHLHTKEHPLAVFEGARLAGTPPPAISADMPVSLEVEGTFLLHGVKKERTFSVAVLRNADDTLTITSRFGVSLAEHDIPRPKFLVLKLADEQDLEIQILARLVPGKGSR